MYPVDKVVLRPNVPKSAEAAARRELAGYYAALHGIGRLLRATCSIISMKRDWPTTGVLVGQSRFIESMQQVAEAIVQCRAMRRSSRRAPFVPLPRPILVRSDEGRPYPPGTSPGISRERLA